MQVYKVCMLRLIQDCLQNNFKFLVVGVHTAFHVHTNLLKLAHVLDFIILLLYL
jgi:hypothetical protein